MRDDEKPGTTQSVVVVDDLVVAYGPHTAVNGLSLRIARGEIFGLLGPNGAGKTTTLNVLEGLRAPSSGTVMIDGVDVLREPLAAKSRIGVQLQASSFQQELSLEQITRLYAGLYGLRLDAGQVRARLDAVGLAGERSKRFKSVSGGQQQRFALLIATLADPVLLLLDEPTEGLDPQSRRMLWARMETLRASGGSILLTTHSMEEAHSVCDRIAIIDHGALCALGTPAELVARYRDDPRVRDVARGDVTLEDVFIGLTGSAIRD